MVEPERVRNSDMIPEKKQKCFKNCAKCKVKYF